jgi:hypothetical protein
MKKTNMQICLAVLTTSILSFSSAGPASLPIGSSLPKADIKLMDISGTYISLKEAAKENGLLVMFSCNTCPVVIRNQSRTLGICSYAKEKKIGVILLNSNEASRSRGDSFEEMRSYGREQGYQWPYVVDKNHELADAFGANKTPECFLFDKAGKLQYHGAIDDSPGNIKQVSRNHLQEAIRELLDSKEITVKETRSVGCTIQR